MEQQLRICYNILPNQSSLIHRLAGDQTLTEGADLTNKLFEICNNNKILHDFNYGKHQMPFFDDADGSNPFDHVLQLNVPDSKED